MCVRRCSDGRDAARAGHPDDPRRHSGHDDPEGGDAAGPHAPGQAAHHGAQGGPGVEPAADRHPRQDDERRRRLIGQSAGGLSRTCQGACVSGRIGVGSHTCRVTHMLGHVCVRSLHVFASLPPFQTCTMRVLRLFIDFIFFWLVLY